MEFTTNDQFIEMCTIYTITVSFSKMVSPTKVHGVATQNISIIVMINSNLTQSQRLTLSSCLINFKMWW